MAKRVIKLLGEPIQDEDYKAAEAITPGMLMALNSSGDLIKNTTTGRVIPRFALEREEMGKDIDDAYATGDTVKSGVFPPGTRVNALIASGQDLDVDEMVEAAADGTVRATATAANAIGKSLDDTGGTVTTLTRLRVQVY